MQSGHPHTTPLFLYFLCFTELLKKKKKRSHAEMSAEDATETDVPGDEARLSGGDWAWSLGKKRAGRPQSR